MMGFLIQRSVVLVTQTDQPPPADARLSLKKASLVKRAAEEPCVEPGHSHGQGTSPHVGPFPAGEEEPRALHPLPRGPRSAQRRVQETPSDSRTAAPRRTAAPPAAEEPAPAACSAPPRPPARPARSSPAEGRTDPATPRGGLQLPERPAPPPAGTGRNGVRRRGRAAGGARGRAGAGGCG